MRRLLLVAFSVWFYTAALVASAVVIPSFTLGVAVTRLVMSRRRTMRVFRWAIVWYGRIVCALAFPVVRIRFQDEEPGREVSGAVIVCNHRAASDAFLVSSLSGEIVQVVNIWPMRLPVLGFFAGFAGYLSVREMEPRAFLARAGRLLEERVAVLAFPEGTRSGSRAVGPFHGMMFRLALESQAPIVPVCIAGNERTPPRGDWVLQPGVIRIRKLRALLPEEYGALDAFHLKNRVRERIAAGLAELEAAA
jgi:1-acyl-sn-glycerol-3-phosphate acyltransferase